MDALFDKFLPKNEDPGQDGPAEQTVLSRDLPALLEEFERQRGYPVIEPWVVPQLEAFVEANPDLPISSSFLVQLIVGLEGALTPSEHQSPAQTPEHPSEAYKHVRDQGTSTDDDSHSSTGSSASSSSEDEGDGSGASHQQSAVHDLSSDSIEFPSHRPQGTIPRSQSDYAELAKGSSSPVPRREKRMSDSVRGHKSSGSDGSKDILKGKGRQRPPSAWNRPRPQALANRARRISDGSAGSLDTTRSQEGDTGLIGLGFRPRQSSQPFNMSDGSDRPPTVPRSVSGGFVFPRATSPIRDYPSAGSASSRAGSPGIDETSFQPFSAISGRSASALDQRSPRSAGFTQLDTYTADDSVIENTKSELLASQDKNDMLQRLLAEKERKLNSLQEEHEEAMFDMQNKIDDLKSDLQALKKEDKELKNNERSLLEQINAFEAEIAQLQKQLETQKNAYTKLKKDYEDQCEVAEKMRESLREKAEEIRAQKDEYEQLSAHARDWEAAKHDAERTVQQLRSELETAQEIDAALTEQRQDNAVLQETIERLRFELEEAKRPSSGFSDGRRGNSNPPSLSKRLGTELAKQMIVHEEVEESGSDTEGEIDPDKSLDSYVETVIQRRRRVKRKDVAINFVSVGIQTETEGQEAVDDGPSSEMIASTSAEPAPPTYDEAALEKEILARTHPIAEEEDFANRGSGSLQEDFVKIQATLGARCTVLERLAQEHDAREEASKALSRAETHEVSGKVSLRKRLSDVATQRVTQYIPSSTLRYISDSVQPKSGSTPADVATRVMFLTALVFAVGLIMGGWFTSSTHHYYHFGSIVEDARAYQLANTLGMPLGFGGDYGEAAVHGTQSGSWLAKLFSRSGAGVGGGGHVVPS